MSWARNALRTVHGLLDPPRTVWLMVPVPAVEGLVQDLAPSLARGDCVVDGGNSPFEEAIRRTEELAPRGIDFVDVGTSGGVWGLERGYCLMIGGPQPAVARLEPVFRALAPGRGSIAPTASGRCNVVFVPRKGRPICVTVADVDSADAALSRLVR